MADIFVVIGGDAAGMSAASKAKREDHDLEVIVFEKGKWVSYGACGLPYYIKGEIDTLEDLISIPAKDFEEKRNIDLRRNQEVLNINPQDRNITVADGSKKFKQDYDKLLISTGARPAVPRIEGRKLEGVFTLHYLPSAEEIRNTLKKSDPPESVGIIGGGYIGMEMAEAFRAHELEVHIFEVLPYVLNSFGEETSKKVEEHLEKKGINLHLDTEVERIVDRDGRVAGIETKEGSTELNMVLFSVGVEPTVELAEESGIEIGETGAIRTDEHGRTNYPEVFAAGDCAEATNTVTGEPDYVPLALTANRSGRAIGQTVAGSPKPVGATAGTAVVKVFDLEAARTGIVDHDRAEEAGFKPATKTITSPSRAHYYPGGDRITVSLTADEKSGKLLGASMMGKEGVAKRIDTVATALHSSMTVSELEYLDLSYAPPFGPTWDPVLIAAKVLNGAIS